MKKILLLSTLLITGLAAQAQVTIQKSSVISGGHEFKQYDDTTQITIQQGGMGALTWDFKNLRFDDSITMQAKNSDWIPSISALIPGSDVILKEKGNEDYTFLSISDTAVHFLGNASDTGTGPLEVEKIGFYFLRYPITHDGTVFNDTTLLFKQLSYLGVVPGPGAPKIDSIRVESFIAQQFKATGHGKIEFPNSTMPDVLMIENLNVIYSDVYAQIGGNWTKVNAAYAAQLGYDVGGDSSYRHMWWSDNNGKGLPVLQYEYDQGDATADGANFSPAEAQLSNVTNASDVNVTAYPNPSAAIVNFDGVQDLAANVKIYAINGVLVHESKLSNGMLDVTSLKTGNYIIHVQNGSEIISTEITKE